MTLVNYKKLLNNVETYLSTKNFRKKSVTNHIFDNGTIRLIFYYSDYHFNCRMYALDSKTFQHIETHYYNFVGFKRPLLHIKSNINTILKRYNGI